MQMMEEEEEEEDDEEEGIEEEQIADLREAIKAKAMKRAQPSNGKSMYIICYIMC